jgi:hypothetical protein
MTFKNWIIPMCEINIVKQVHTDPSKMDSAALHPPKTKEEICTGMNYSFQKNQ